MSRIVCRVALTVAFGCALTTGAWAGQTGQCIKAASVEYRECKGVCKEDYQIAKDACLNKDHICVEACREERAECREATGFDAAIDACNDEKEAAIATCKTLYAAGTPERDQCIDNAQLAGFQCRDGVREELKDDLTACRKGDPALGIQGFRPCVAACPEGAGPVEDPKQCKLDAKTAYKACGAACREDFQIAKDACRNRDHVCVEQCRTDREACKDPIQDALDAAVAACKATKQAAVDVCQATHPAGSAELDACIDQAQAVAFQCRDQAREDAKPGFAACRAAFRTCVQACPPPPPAP
jgi:hypothetical protein